MPAPSQVDSEQLAATLALPVDHVVDTLRLLDEGNTSSFLARYRKDAIGGISEAKIREIQRQAAKLRSLEDRKATIRKSLQSRGELNAALANAIQAAGSAKDLEDLYLPFKARKQTLAALARQRGLEPLAKEISDGTLSAEDLDVRLANHAADSDELNTPDDVLAGAGHILAERMSDRADVRSELRRIIQESGQIVSSRLEADTNSTAGLDAKQREKIERAFRDYFAFTDTIRGIPPHRILALNRGERSKVLRVRIEIDSVSLLDAIQRRVIPETHPQAMFLRRCASDALQRLIQPSLEREFRRELTDRAEEHAIRVFACNLRNLLLQPPVRGHRVVAIAAGFRSGCKLATLDEFGNVLDHDVIHVIGDPRRRAEGRATLVRMVRDHHASVVAIGNGNACRQAEQLVADVIANELAEIELAYTIVNEAGASAYSTSMVGVEELPQFDAEMRSAISIGRRLLDPLSELVKINPANIGVGMYQHDIKTRNLQETLDDVVAACVNFVSVDVNRASPALLRYVSGLNQLSARRLYEYRCQHGPFRSREQFRDVPTFGDVTFVQASGFLKIHDGDNPLDATLIHPESYPLAKKLQARLSQPDLPPDSTHARRTPVAVASQSSNAAVRDVREDSIDATVALATESITIHRSDVSSTHAGGQPPSAPELKLSDLRKEFDVGERLLADIVSELTEPPRDPRDKLPSPVFRRSILKLDDLKPGMELRGTVLNVVDFGAFVDIGISDSALVHISRLVNRFVDDPHEVVGVGDVMRVWVLTIDKKRRRVSLTAIAPDESGITPSSTDAHPKPASKKEHGQPPRPHLPAGTGRVRTRRPPKTKVAPVPAQPLSEGMAAGKEPLRSFADLKQFLSTSKQDPSPTTRGKPKPSPPEISPPETSQPQVSQSDERDRDQVGDD